VNAARLVTRVVNNNKRKPPVMRRPADTDGVLSAACHHYTQNTQHQPWQTGHAQHHMKDRTLS